MRYRCIIADDEKKIIQLIKQLGNFKELEIEIVDECNNGRQVFDSIMEKKPDFVLSDIKMPIFDGIQLIEKVREQNLDTLFILLSGYRHFEYARSAIQLNVMDYLLKPIDEEQLNETLEKVCRKIDQLKEIGEKNKILKEIEIKEEKSRLQKFWECVVFKKEIEKLAELKSVEECNEYFGTEFMAPGYQIFCIVSNLNAMLEYGDSLFFDKINTFIKKNFSELGKALFFATYQGYILILNYNENKKAEVKKAITVLYHNIRDLNEYYGQFRLNIGVSNIKHSHKELREAFEEAQAAEWGRLIFWGDNIIEYNQVKNIPGFTPEQIFDREEQKLIGDCVKYLRKEELSNLFSVIYKRASLFNNANPSNMAQAIFVLREIIGESIKEKEEQERLQEKLFYAYLESKNYAQVYKNIYLELEVYMDGMHKSLKEKMRKPIHEAIQFMEENYMRQVSLDEVAEISNVSPTYLCKLFKEEVKMGFTDFLTKIRLEESQRLLEETNMAVKEIAVAVGYADEKYYSKLFKKTTGIKPTDYRKLYG